MISYDIIHKSYDMMPQAKVTKSDRRHHMISYDDIISYDIILPIPIYNTQITIHLHYRYTEASPKLPCSISDVKAKAVIFSNKQQLLGSSPDWLFSQTKHDLGHLEADTISCLGLLNIWV